MNATTVAVDLAKSVFQLAVADEHWKVVGRARLTRGQFERWFHNRAVCLVVMEACATAHYWARTLRARGIEVRLLPAKYVRVYVKRNTTYGVTLLYWREESIYALLGLMATHCRSENRIWGTHPFRG